MLLELLGFAVPSLQRFGNISPGVIRDTFIMLTIN